MVSVNQSTAAFTKGYREAGGAAAAAQHLRSSTPANSSSCRVPRRCTGWASARSCPSPFRHRRSPRSSSACSQNTAGRRDDLLYQLREFMGAKVLVEALRRAGPNPSSEKCCGRWRRSATTMSAASRSAFRQQPGRFALCRSDRHRTQRHTAALIVFHIVKGHISYGIALS